MFPYSALIVMYFLALGVGIVLGMLLGRRFTK